MRLALVLIWTVASAAAVGDEEMVPDMPEMMNQQDQQIVVVPETPAQNTTEEAANLGDTTPSLSAPGPEPTPPPASTAPPIGNPSILGCLWPSDFETRYEFCAEKAGIEFEDGHVKEHDVTYGLLDPAILGTLQSNCASGNLSECVKPVDKEPIQAFAERWRTNGEKNKEFQTCLQENTEAMNRLCNADSEVGRVVSGAAGLQLNLIGALDRLHHLDLPDGKNLSDGCFYKMVETVHITAALYLQSEHYMDNSVLCWNVVGSECNQECSAFAAQLNCLLAQCPEVPLRVFQEFGIWQWYYLNAKLAGQKCGLEGKKCATVEEAGSGVSGSASLFDMDKIKKKFNAMSASLEHTFNLPFSVLLAIAVSAFVAFFASALMLCMWKYGLCGKKKRKLRYSRLDEEEGKRLTDLPDQLLD